MMYIHHRRQAMGHARADAGVAPYGHSMLWPYAASSPLRKNATCRVRQPYGADKHTTTMYRRYFSQPRVCRMLSRVRLTAVQLRTISTFSQVERSPS